MCRPKHPGRDIDAGMLSRAQGCLLGQMAGDALGSLVEFQTPEQIRGEYPNGVRRLIDGGTWDTIAGQPTDDTEMALMLARSLVQDGTYKVDSVLAAYKYWLNSDPFDIGSTISGALTGRLNQRPLAKQVAWIFGHRTKIQEKDGSTFCVELATGCKAPGFYGKNHESQANGALMRVSPLGIFGAGHSLDQTADWAQRDAALTHPNPVCKQINALFAMAVAHAIKTGESPQALYRNILKWAGGMLVDVPVLNVIRGAMDEPPEDYTRHQGWVLVAFHNALYQLLNAKDLEAGIVDTVMRGGDTDTNAAICGALLGAVHGRDGIPRQWSQCILTCRPLAGQPGVRRPRPECFWPVDAMVLAERLLERRH